jgi:hypothetical protein
MPQESALFSGDHVMAWSTSVVAPLDGAMRHYMASGRKNLLAGQSRSRDVLSARSSSIAARGKPRSSPASRPETRRFPRSSPMSTRASTRRLPTRPPHRSALTSRISWSEGSSGPKERARLAPSIERPEPIALARHRALRRFRRAHFLSTTASSAASKLAILRGLAPKS